MIRFLQRHVPLTLWMVALALVGTGVTMAGCAPGLPEPESEGAQLYVQYCSGEGCHSPIPPQGGGKGYWRNQYDRMLPIMDDAGWELPDSEQERKIREYLARFAS
jgi:hypothetical protein